MKKLHNNKVLLSDIALFIVAIIWGSGFIVTKNALNDIPPLFLTGFRFAFASLFLICIFYKRLAGLKKSDLLGSMMVGVILFIAFTTREFDSLNRKKSLEALKRLYFFVKFHTLLYRTFSYCGIIE